MTHEVRTYLDFLGYCLNDSSEKPLEIVNWRNLLTFAKKQTIVGIYWQGIQRLGNVANRPSEDDVMEWMGEYQKIVRRSNKVDKALADLLELLKDNDIDFFVFKGQTVAQSYPVPESRTSGDVDFYVFKKDWDKAIDILGKNVEIKDHHSFRHLDFEMEGIPFEMHYHTTVFGSNKTQNYWDDMIDSYFDEVLDHVEISGEAIPTLPPTTYCIYLFIHLYHHFLKEGVGLRQFVDWMMFIRAKHEEIVMSELDAKLHKIGLCKAFRAFGSVLVDKLGLDSNEFPYVLTDSDRKYEEEILGIVLQYGNFGKFGRSTPALFGRREKTSGWWHSIETGSRSVHHLLKFFWLSPKENFLMLPKLLSHSLKKNMANNLYTSR